ncbi:hypothetical protein C2S52_016271 [Perilla frutescens var. hirtella]|nr:hypothetical protein C2S52_016271 [Perilla frutescens var. hirtella]KAH6815012.1 hypothetical protein C2S51_019832 [Perilla frutescens var. frutescens]
MSERFMQRRLESTKEVTRAQSRRDCALTRRGGNQRVRRDLHDATNTLVPRARCGYGSGLPEPPNRPEPEPWAPLDVDSLEGLVEEDSNVGETTIEESASDAFEVEVDADVPPNIEVSPDLFLNPMIRHSMVLKWSPFDTGGMILKISLMQHVVEDFDDWFVFVFDPGGGTDLRTNSFQ